MEGNGTFFSYIQYGLDHLFAGDYFSEHKNGYISGHKIYQKVTQRKGYTLQAVTKPVRLNFEFEPEWLQGSLLDRVKLFELEGTIFYLESIVSSSGKTNFTISFEPTMHRDRGFFLSNTEFHPDGTNNYYSHPPLWRMYDYNMNKLDIDIVGIGQGELQFSFILDNVDVQVLRTDGFVMEYSGLVLYEYFRD